MYFKLNNSCFIKSDDKGSVLYNLAKKDLVELNIQETNLLTYAENGGKLSHEQINSDLLISLKNMGWGFFSNHKYFIDKLRPYNKFSLSRLDLFPLIPSTAYLQLTGQCSLGADLCKSKFCMPCKCFDNTKTLTIDIWKKVIDSLIEFGTSNFILTGGNIFKCSYLIELINYIRNLEASVSIIINEPDENIYCLDPDTKIICNQCSFEYSDKMLLDLAKHFKNMIFMSEKNVSFPADRFIKIKSEYKIDEKNFVKPDVNKYYMRKNRDLCLLGKVFITMDGNIIPCFQMADKIIGNVLIEDIKIIIKKLADQHWNINYKYYSKCKDCRWFYACTSCQAFDAEKNCMIK